jgi:hypothetical protein
MTAQSMSLMMNSLADLDHPENLNLELQTGKAALSDCAAGRNSQSLTSHRSLKGRLDAGDICESRD